MVSGLSRRQVRGALLMTMTPTRTQQLGLLLLLAALVAFVAWRVA